MRLRTSFDSSVRPFGLFFRRQFARRNIEQERRHAGIREVRGNLRPHRSRAQNRSFFNSHVCNKTGLGPVIFSFFERAALVKDIAPIIILNEYSFRQGRAEGFGPRFFDCRQAPVLQGTLLFQAMSSVSNTSSRKRRLIRGVALLFLIYTAIDIAAPDLCRGEILGDIGQGSIAAAAPGSTDSLDSSVARIGLSAQQPSDSSEQPSDDDDCCFCCCAHVLPARVTAAMAVTDIRSPVTRFEYLSVPSPPLAPEFHPPRFA